MFGRFLCGPSEQLAAHLESAAAMAAGPLSSAARDATNAARDAAAAAVAKEKGAAAAAAMAEADGGNPGAVAAAAAADGDSLDSKASGDAKLKTLSPNLWVFFNGYFLLQDLPRLRALLRRPDPKKGPGWAIIAGFTLVRIGLSFFLLLLLLTNP